MDGAARESSSVVVDSPLDRARAEMLPGLGGELLCEPISDEVVDRLPVYTAERVLALDPFRYSIAAALFFCAPTISKREICRLCRISQHTLEMIIEREERGRTAEQWRESASMRLRRLSDRAMDVGENLMRDDEVVRKSGLGGVAAILREATHAHELMAQRLPGQQKPANGSDDVKDYFDSFKRAEVARKSIEVVEKEESRGEAERGSELV